VTRGYDFVLMDVAFPGIDGLEAARRIRALPGVAGRTPIVGISGASEARDEEATRAAGMDFYLRKPVSPSAVSHRNRFIRAAILGYLGMRGRVLPITTTPCPSAR